MRMSSHEGGGAFPGGVNGMVPPGLFGGKQPFGDGSYSGNVIQGGSVLQPVGGVLTITGAATVAPDAVTGASVVMCDTLIIDGSSASLRPSTNSKGLIVFAKTKVQLLNGGKLNIDKLGKAGNFGNVTLASLIPEALRGKIGLDLTPYVLVGEGAPGVAGVTGNVTAGRDGNPATLPFQTGGGAGASSGTPFGDLSGAGGKGGPCCGGAGGGGVWTDGGVQGRPKNGGDYGGPGGDTDVGGNAPWPAYGQGAGAGDPVGYSGGSADCTPSGAGGGFLFIATALLDIASGCIVSADGAQGGWASSSSTKYCGGGSAGGGVVVAVTKVRVNNGTIRASGGPKSPGYYYDSYGTTYGGGAGGAGSVNTFTI